MIYYYYVVMASDRAMSSIVTDAAAAAAGTWSTDGGNVDRVDGELDRGHHHPQLMLFLVAAEAEEEGQRDGEEVYGVAEAAVDLREIGDELNDRVDNVRLIDDTESLFRTLTRVSLL